MAKKKGKRRKFHTGMSSALSRQCSECVSLPKMSSSEHLRKYYDYPAIFRGTFVSTTSGISNTPASQNGVAKSQISTIKSEKKMFRGIKKNVTGMESSPTWASVYTGCILF